MMQDTLDKKPSLNANKLIIITPFRYCLAFSACACNKAK